jgi:predicted Zn-ribbon and HTH transcriptional regulator
MAICKYCQLEMNEADGCTGLPVPTIDGLLNPIPYGAEQQHLKMSPNPGQRHHGILIGDPPRCHDCGVLPGSFHHPGCDWEECPRCHEQLIGCECDPNAKPSSEPEVFQ